MTYHNPMTYIAPETINERSLLMCRQESGVLLGDPTIGEEIYQIWLEQLDIARPDDFYLEDYYEEYTLRYHYEDIKNLFEQIRLIMCSYDDLIDQVVSQNSVH